ncbi:MAG: hypothetical protein LC130_23570 [Bryobacterales bacterium]|jgi:hypothetical protein|nr:hypothetical protein [Bryobacterales bacterium]
MPKSICDFCSSPTVTWVYPARTFAAYVFEGIVGESVGDWAACPTCHGLIESGRHAELTERSLTTLLERQPEMKGAEAELRNQIRGFHTMFFRNRVGTAMTIA